MFAHFHPGLRGIKPSDFKYSPFDKVIAPAAFMESGDGIDSFSLMGGRVEKGGSLDISGLFIHAIDVAGVQRSFDLIETPMIAELLPPPKPAPILSPPPSSCSVRGCSAFSVSAAPTSSVCRLRSSPAQTVSTLSTSPPGELRRVAGALRRRARGPGHAAPQGRLGPGHTSSDLGIDGPRSSPWPGDAILGNLRPFCGRNRPQISLFWGKIREICRDSVPFACMIKQRARRRAPLRRTCTLGTTPHDHPQTDRGQPPQRPAQSTGPKNTERSRFNAATHGLAGADDLLPPEHTDALNLHIATFTNALHPVDDYDAFLIRTAAVAAVRLDLCHAMQDVRRGTLMRRAGRLLGRRPRRARRRPRGAACRRPPRRRRAASR